ncbi:MAG: hypothetical protein Q7R60_02975 [bacterium]|nr:hypothetical protein [bacterium]
MNRIDRLYERLGLRAPKSSETIEREMLSQYGVRLIETNPWGELPASLDRARLGQMALAAHREYGDTSVVLSEFFNPAKQPRVGEQLDPEA